MESNKIIENLKELNLSQRYLAKLFKRTPQQINDAIHNDWQPTLRKKIEKHIIKKLNSKIKAN